MSDKCISAFCFNGFLLLFVFLSGILIFSPDSHAEEYTLYSNKNLQLCHDFLEMLNDKPVGYYARHYPFDPKFKEFSPLKMSPVSKDDYFHQIEKNAIDEYSEKGESKSEIMKNIKKLKEDFYSDDYEIYVSKSFDYNHSGGKEKFLIKKVKGESDLYLFCLIKDGNIVTGSESIYFSGYPFIYKGRFYLASIHGKIASISETSYKKPNKDSFWKYTVCQYR